MTNTRVLLGRAQPNPSQSLRLFDDVIDDHWFLRNSVRKADRVRPSPTALRKLGKVMDWVEQNSIPDADITIYYLFYENQATLEITMRYYLQLHSIEHRTLFMLCRETLLDIQEEAA